MSDDELVMDAVANSQENAREDEPTFDGEAEPLKELRPSCVQVLYMDVSFFKRMSRVV